MILFFIHLLMHALHHAVSNLWLIYRFSLSIDSTMDSGQVVTMLGDAALAGPLQEAGVPCDAWVAVQAGSDSNNRHSAFQLLCPKSS